MVFFLVQTTKNNTVYVIMFV